MYARWPLAAALAGLALGIASCSASSDPAPARLGSLADATAARLRPLEPATPSPSPPTVTSAPRVIDLAGDRAVGSRARSDARAAATASGTSGSVRVPILMYHHISVPPVDSDSIRLGLSVVPDAFDLQMAYLAIYGYHPVRLADLEAALAGGGSLPETPIVLTFDDGYADNYQNAFPVLRKRGFVATFFVITRFADEERSDYMTWAQLGDMAGAGMEIAAHSVDHPNLQGKPLGFQFDQIVGSKLAIESHVGMPVRSFAYPSGRYDGTTIEVLRATGYQGAVTEIPGVWQSPGDPFELRRVRVGGRDGIQSFDRRLHLDQAPLGTEPQPR
jgi:peptidoglycan/xylan/chitin deacetylase (PgdA/CDA1 family)